MVLDRFSDVSVSFFFTGPAPLFGVGLQCSDVGELVGQASTTRLRPTTTPKPPPPKKTPAVVLRSDLAFGFDSAKVSGRARAAVIRLARQSRAANLTGTIVVEGFTDNLGSAAHGRRLSQQRADAVAAILREYLRGTSLRVIAHGLGEANPVRSNATAAGTLGEPAGHDHPARGLDCSAAAFSRDETIHAAMGRFGNVILAKVRPTSVSPTPPRA